ncbi:hypothetical protein O1611_g9784 [Lasiodiplodia mahajangana]|uniref:Uncharacterized protein n=1 Tax=Lasiodiplodia mahajangana TaxID=1108764 RepID=A0ACC2J5D9_9PEZI|nr:hypothetical protein O1611_g9784 [Lasiodiplodia mahajangana]
MQKRASLSSSDNFALLLPPRAEIAFRICQAHKPQKKPVDTEDITGILTLDDAPDNDGDPFMFSVAEEFIFGSDPISYLEENICAFIRKPKQKWFSRLAINLRSYTALAICDCQVIDDYESKYDGAIEVLERRLKQYNQVTQPIQQDYDTAQSSWKVVVTSTVQWFLKSLTKAKSHDPPSHRHKVNGPSIQLGQCVKSAGTAQANHNFVLFNFFNFFGSATLARGMEILGKRFGYLEKYERYNSLK